MDKKLDLLPVPGIRLAGVAAGIKKRGGLDLGLIVMDEGTVTSSVFTKNAFAAAPVIVAKQHLASTSPRYLLVNSGNANAGTGQAGLASARQTCAALAALVKGTSEEVLPFSTGVIGEPFPEHKIIAGLPMCLRQLSEEGWADFGRAILTTDTFGKGISEQIDLDGTKVTITGVCKGSGMIRPDMATMLAFIATDVCLPSDSLQRLLQQTTENSFNRIIVDGDMSTNDACVLMASGQSGVEIVPGQASWEKFCDALLNVALGLAKAIVRDGEGATKFVTIQVQGGADESECRMVADAIARSPLVKTAFFASDPNWGRILAAVGYAGVPNLEVNLVTIHLDDCCIVRNGGRADEYQEADGAAVMAKSDFVVLVDLGRGQSKTEVYTCDFSYDYVRINAEYRT